MSRIMLINARHQEECRVAIVDHGRLVDLEIDRADQVQLRGNIYKAAITRVEPSLQAAFLDIGSTRNGFLQINDIHPAYFNNWPKEPNEGGRRNRPYIQDVLHAGQELVVQVVKDEREAKGATLTTNLSIPGRYLVLMVGNQRGGVSRKIADESQRFKLRQAVRDLVLPPGMGVIVRTAGIDKSIEELELDLEGLLEIWHEIINKSLAPGAPTILYKESDLAFRTVRDYLTSDISEVLVDNAELHEQLLVFANRVMPNMASRIVLHDRGEPLFSAYNIDSQVDAVNQPEVTLPSGGSIVINVTEAIVAIDVNSGRATTQADVEQTAFETNREAAEAVATQLRLRDLGGLVVIDFIDMIDRRHKRVVEKTLRDAVRLDKAKVELGRISKFGLMEMSRQRLKSSLVSQHQTLCPHCNGRGRVKTAESAALDALRKIESAIHAGGVREIKVRMAPAAALFLLNSKRQLLSSLESSLRVSIMIYADGRLKPEEYELSLNTGKSSVEAVVSSHSRPAPAPSRQPRYGHNRDRSEQQSRGQQHGRNRGHGGGHGRHERRDDGDSQGGGGSRRRNDRRRGGRRNRNNNNWQSRGPRPDSRQEGQGGEEQRQRPSEEREHREPSSDRGPEPVSFTPRSGENE